MTVKQLSAAGRQTGEGTAGKDYSGRGLVGQLTEKSLCGYSTERWNKDQLHRLWGLSRK